jgi:succinoglycan biosynthesis protein ExoV
MRVHHQRIEPVVYEGKPGDPMELSWERLAYYRWDGNNLGDRPLNDWIIRKWFPRLPTVAPEHPSAILLAVGSILGQRTLCMPKQMRDVPWIIFGSGHHHDGIDLPANAIAFALRGRLTYEALAQRYPETLREGMPALADPGILLPKYLPRDIDFIPGKQPTIYKYDWKRARETEFAYTTRTDPDFCGWIRRLWTCERIQTHSLHAALIADAYGIPWKPLRWEPKWTDAFEQLGIPELPSDFTLSDRKLLTQQQGELEEARLHLIRYVDQNTVS